MSFETVSPSDTTFCEEYEEVTDKITQDYLSDYNSDNDSFTENS